MKPNQLERQITWPESNERKTSRKLSEPPRNSQVGLAKRTILLLSQDTHLQDSLRGLANGAGMLVVRLDAMRGVVPAMRAISPAVVLLDLDLPNEAAWGLADALLQEQNCPAVMLLSSHCEQFDVNTALRTDSIIDKSEGPARVLEATHEILSLPPSNLSERNAILRVLIRWLKPCSWSLTGSPAQRFWGINE